MNDQVDRIRQRVALAGDAGATALVLREIIRRAGPEAVAEALPRDQPWLRVHVGACLGVLWELAGGPGGRTVLSVTLRHRGKVHTIDGTRLPSGRQARRGGEYPGKVLCGRDLPTDRTNHVAFRVFDRLAWCSTCLRLASRNA